MDGNHGACGSNVDENKNNAIPTTSNEPSKSRFFSKVNSKKITPAKSFLKYAEKPKRGFSYFFVLFIS